MADDEENPFENRPIEFDRKTPRPASTKTSATTRVDPFRGKAVWERDTAKRAEKKAEREHAPVGRTREALIAGFGLILNIILLYIVGVVAAWDGAAIGLSVLGLVFATLQPFFFMREQLPIAALDISPVRAKFLAGILGGLVGLILIVSFVTFSSTFEIALGILALCVSAWISATLLLYALYEVESE